MRRSARNAVVAAAGLAVALGTLAIDHLVGTEPEPGEAGLADPGAFAIGAAIALVLTGALFGIVVRRAATREPRDVALKAAAYAALAVLTVPLLFLAVPFPSPPRPSRSTWTRARASGSCSPRRRPSWGRS